MNRKRLQEGLNIIKNRVLHSYRDEELWRGIELIQKELGIAVHITEETPEIRYRMTQAESLIQRFGEKRARKHKSWPKVPEKMK